MSFKFLSAAVVGTVALGAQAAFGAFSIADLNAATKLATDNFQTAQPDHVAHFTGYKAWLSGEEAKVKIYVSHDGMNMEFNYNCHHHEDNELECHAQ
jgi:hypothetical protein